MEGCIATSKGMLLGDVYITSNFCEYLSFQVRESCNVNRDDLNLPNLTTSVFL